MQLNETPHGKPLPTPFLHMVRKHLILIVGHLTKMCGCPSTVNWNNSNHFPACHHAQQSMCNMMHWAISKMPTYLRKSTQYEASHCAVLTVLHLSPNTLFSTPFKA
jgi:hypothetical protein